MHTRRAGIDGLSQSTHAAQQTSKPDFPLGRNGPSTPTEENIVIRSATIRDAEVTACIYNHYIANTVITFEERTIAPEQMAERIETVTSAALPWLVAEHDGHVLGYAYATQWKGRSAYRFSVETTVYLAAEATGRGIGSALYEALFTDLEARDVHVAVGGITLPNPASVALHEKLGMKKVAHFEQIGFKFGQWLDVGYWQKTL